MRWVAITGSLSLMIACSSGAPSTPTTLVHLPLDSPSEIISSHLAGFDSTESSDGAGSLIVQTAVPVIVQVACLDEIDAEDCRLSYQAFIRSDELEGSAFLEMWCYFDGKGEFFSRDVATPITGTTEWTRETTPFYLRSGERPDRVTLNLIITGSGTVWIDDISVVRQPV